MMSADKRTYKNQWDYLETNGYLSDHITEDELNEGKRKWRRYYKRMAKRKERKMRREVTVSFVSTDELNQMKGLAKNHNLPLSTFLKQASFAYARQEYVFPHHDQLDQIIHLLALIRSNTTELRFDLEDGVINGQQAIQRIKLQTEQWSREIEEYISKPTDVDSLRHGEE